MTPTQLVHELKVPQGKVDRIKAFARSLEEFETVLHEHDIRGRAHAADTPLRQGILTQAQQCVDAIAKILNQDPQKILATLLLLFEIKEQQYQDSCTISAQIIAFSAVVESLQP